ncbi:MAG: arginase family protein, partial [Bacteroidota bacterium]
MSLSPLHYRRASCLSITTRGDAYEVTHQLNGRKFVLPAPAYQVLGRLQQPMTLDQLLEHFPAATPPEKVASLLEGMRVGGIVVATGDDETYHRRLPNQTLLGVPTFDAAKATDRDHPRVVFLGLPFGGGNKLDNGCAKFPAQLRWFAQTYLAGLHARAAELDFRGFGADNAFFAPLRRWLTENRLTDGGDLFLQENEYPSSIYAKVERLAAEISNGGNIPLFLGGDHSLSFPTISGVAKQHERFQVIQFDAHTDTYANNIASLYASSGKATHHHGNFLSRVLE